MPTRRKAIIWTNGGLVYWCVNAWFGLNELMKWAPFQCYQCITNCLLLDFHGDREADGMAYSTLVGDKWVGVTLVEDWFYLEAIKGYCTWWQALLEDLSWGTLKVVVLMTWWRMFLIEILFFIHTSNKWHTCFAIISYLTVRLLHIFAYATTAQLLRHVQNI